MTTRIDIGIFAYNEADSIAPMIETLLRQDLFADAALDVRLHVLANGCSDATCDLARTALAGEPRAQVHDLHPGGKSRTWNVFVHELARPETDILMFCDADIALPDAQTLQGLIDLLQAQPERHATVSFAVKDIVHDAVPLTGMDRLIARAGGTLDDWQHSICGQLYAMRADVARSFHLPVGLPVEDGFVRAMIVTDGLIGGSDLSRIWGDARFFHVYASERSLGALIRHQVRIVIGSAINSVLFDVLTRDPARTAADILKEAQDDPDWLARTLRRELPRRYGYIPWRFATKRLRGLSLRGGLGGNAIRIMGFGFDTLVYIIAQWRMFRGAGAGFW